MRHPIRRAAVVGAGSFGTAIAVLLERSGVRTTLVTRTAEQAGGLEVSREKVHSPAGGERGALGGSRENVHYLEGVELPGGLRVRALDSEEEQFRRADAIFLAVP